MTDVREDETRSAGRGLLWVTGGKVFFIATAYVVAFALPRVFGSEEVFGVFSVAFGAASMLNAVLIVSTLQTVSKLVSEDEARAPAILRRALGLQLAIGASLASALALAAPWLATHVFRSEAFVPLVRVAAVVIFAYALYAALIGYLNGRKQFERQAQLDMTFSVLRTIGLVGGAALGLGAVGAMGGFAVAATAILLLALSLVGPGASTGPGVGWKSLLGFLAPIWLYQAALQGMMQIDLQVLHYVAAGLAADAGEADPTSVSDALSGVYRAVQTFAFVPYQLILSVTFVVFPFVSRATTLGDAEAARRYIAGAMRFSLLVLFAIATPIAGAAEGVLRFVYPAGYQVGAGALEILVFGQVAFALFVIGATIVAGAGRPGAAAAVATIGLTVVVGATWALLATLGLERALVATALGTSAGTLVALVATAAMVWRAHGTFLPLASVARALAAGAVAFAVARAIPTGHALGALGALVLGLLAYAGVLVALRELGADELAALRRVLRRGR
ncbi:MAG: oligosaccharide flippase family protein [Sandaracinaceae bacterium]|nr:oligosaccharide flippase family protein [Sandaracinaceae bacterium]